MSHYAWIITKDYMPDTKYPEGSNMNAKGVAGPHDASEEQIDWASRHGFDFRLLDDDGEVMYKGRLFVETEFLDGVMSAVQYPEYRGPVCSWAVDEEAGFGPLNDFGTPNAGATEIQYRCSLPDGTRVWATL
jgi:hypothetical protein